MRKRWLVSICLVVSAVFFISFRENSNVVYAEYYNSGLGTFRESLESLVADIQANDQYTVDAKEKLRRKIGTVRHSMKSVDFWLRYLDPLAYKSVNGPLPVEWETEVFEKHEKPYKRIGAGLTLALLYLDEPRVEKDSLLHLVEKLLSVIDVYCADSTTKALTTFHHFYLCNRLFILNLASIYTTGFECPQSDSIVPELRTLLKSVDKINRCFNASFPESKLPTGYMQLFDGMCEYVREQPRDYTAFDHFTFLREYVNPLFVLNQKAIRDYKVVSSSLVDYTLSKQAKSIFDKDLYSGQDAKGLFLRVKDKDALAAIEKVGKLLFYDPILSGNNMRSCASCHKPNQFFTDTSVTTPLNYNNKEVLNRNSPSLVNVIYNHLIMLDGKHITLQNQTLDVVTNPMEMGSAKEEVVRKVLSCKEYRKTFRQLMKYTPQEKEISFNHIASAITYYYSRFSSYYSPFDSAMSQSTALGKDAVAGFNIFMGKAQCATCHFVPQFNGVKPPFIGSEFEVLGVPSDTAYSGISPDEGRALIYASKEMQYAFRTGSLRNAEHTKPYMHNGVFRTLEQVIDFYDAGGGAGSGMALSNQTLSSDSLHLTLTEKHQLISFIQSLSESIKLEAPPYTLPVSNSKYLNKRIVGGVY